MRPDDSTVAIARSGHIAINTTPTPEMALRVAQFARTHCDSVANLNAIEPRFEYDERVDAFLNTKSTAAVRSSPRRHLSLWGQIRRSGALSNVRYATFTNYRAALVIASASTHTIVLC